MNERVRKIRKALGLTLEQFGERLGVGKTAISKIESGDRGVTDQMCKSICREFNVDEEWLRTGTGGAEVHFIKQTRNEEIASFINSVQQDSDESFRKRLIAILSEMTVDEWKLLENMATRLVREADGAEPAATAPVTSLTGSSEDKPVVIRAAHLNPDATPEQIAADDAIMEGDDF